MEAFALYLIKSVIWLSGFALVYVLFLRNERFFLLNRLYLIAGILTAFFFPLISVHYTVVLPLVKNIQADNAIVSGIQNVSYNNTPDPGLLLLTLYLSGVLFVTFMIIKQSKSVLKSIKKAEIITSHPVKLIRTAEYTSSFSFFSYVFVNPSITDVETKEIVNHELVHIRQRHWLDLVLVELLCILQWFNPLIWIYIRFIRQNHEYLADEVALQRTSDPAIYRAALLNQIVGAPVVSLANSFNYSLNKKRFNMMKNIISSPYRKMKIFLILPVFAIVLYSFAKPDYRYTYVDESYVNNDPVSTASIKEVKGIVVQQEGNNPLQGATIMVRGTNLGVLTDAKGFFRLNNVPDEGLLVVSYVGFKSKVVKPVFTSEMTIKMVRDTVKYLNANISTPPPPPPPPPPPLFVIDGEISNKHYSTVSKENIQSINVLNTEKATEKYGEKARYGAVEITTKKKAIESQDKIVIRSTYTPPPPPAFKEYNEIKSKNGILPLVIIDGKITDVDINSIDLKTVESISVLKDKSATAVFGEKGKDGVIVITTKKVVKQASEKEVLTYKLTEIGTPDEKLNLIAGEPRPLILIDGVISDIDLKTIDPGNIQSISVLKDPRATDKYGEKGKDGVIEITTKKYDSLLSTKMSDVKVTGYGKVQKADDEKVVIIEELPEFPGGGKDVMREWISQNVKYPAEAVRGNITGTVYVDFMISSTGKVKNVQVARPVHPLLDTEAKRVISNMPDWKPGSQAGKPVDVQMMVPVEFKLQ
ncbi:MAG: TonB family protein [Bacteroidales bacterium]